MTISRREVLRYMATGAVAASVAPAMQPALALTRKKLFEPVTIGSLTVKNRIFKAATSYNMADEHGRPTQGYLDVYAEAARGGPGLVVTDVTYVDYDDRPSHADLSIHHDDQIPAFRKISETIRENGAKSCLQIGWAGSMTITRTVWGNAKYGDPRRWSTP